MQLNLTSHEFTAFKAFRASQPDLPDECHLDLGKSFVQLREAFQTIIAVHQGATHQGEVVVVGILNQAYDLLLGAVGEISIGNPHVWAACIRGLYECLGALVYLRESPERCATFLDTGVSAGKLRSASARLRPQFAKDFDKLNSLVHPGAAAIHAGFRVDDAQRDVATLTLGPQPLGRAEALEGTSVMITLAKLIDHQLHEIVDGGAVVTAGRVIMEKRP